MTAIETIPNVGPATAGCFRAAGLETAEQIRELGADAAYLHLLRAGETPHFIGYYALVLGLQGRPWHDLKEPEKSALRARFDALKREAATGLAPAGIEKLLDEIGVRPVTR